ncbi:MAG TPA: hypothetical protein VFS97_13110 [Nitrososphaeraceae archaeon]|nr:hypothetical protein [Nitrososphaeraceae archaeon]
MSAKLEDNASELQELRLQYQKLQETYQKILPKVDPNLIDDLLSRRQKDPYTEPMYTIEVFTRDKIDTEAARWYIFGKTGMMPAIYDHGTHFVTDQKLTLETLKEISDGDDVIEVTGEYSGSFASNGPMHECHV